MTSTGYSRYPVSKFLDDIRGIVHFKELTKPLIAGKSLDEIQPWIRPTLIEDFVYLFKRYAAQ